MTIKLRSFLAFGVIFILLLCLGGYQYIQSYLQMNQIKSIKNITLQSTILADELKLSVVQVQQDLSGISASRGENGLNDGFKKATQASNVFYKDITLLKTINPSDAKKLNAIKSSFDFYFKTGKQMANQYIQSGPINGNQMMPLFSQLADDINTKVGTYQHTYLSRINQSLQNIEKINHKNEVILISFGSTIFILGLIIAFLLSRSILNPLKDLLKATEVITRGDLRHPIQLNSKDEIGILATSFEDMRLNLSKLISRSH